MDVFYWRRRILLINVKYKVVRFIDNQFELDERADKENEAQTHDVIYYNLDMIISIGYRVKSQRGIIF